MLYHHAYFISDFSVTGNYLAIIKATWYVNESDLLNSLTYTFIVFQRGLSILFFLFEDRVTNKNQIHCYKLFDNAPIISIKNDPSFQHFNTYQDVLFFFHSCFRIIKSLFQNFFNSLYERGVCIFRYDFFCCLQSLVIYHISSEPFHLGFLIKHLFEIHLFLEPLMLMIVYCDFWCFKKYLKSLLEQN